MTGALQEAGLVLDILSSTNGLVFLRSRAFYYFSFGFFFFFLLPSLAILSVCCSDPLMFRRFLRCGGLDRPICLLLFGPGFGASRTTHLCLWIAICIYPSLPFLKKVLSTLNSGYPAGKSQAHIPGPGPGFSLVPGPSVAAALFPCVFVQVPVVVPVQALNVSSSALPRLSFW